jgi:hypothetical protein
VRLSYGGVNRREEERGKKKNRNEPKTRRLSCFRLARARARSRGGRKNNGNLSNQRNTHVTPPFGGFSASHCLFLDTEQPKQKNHAHIKRKHTRLFLARGAALERKRKKTNRAAQSQQQPGAALR